MLSEEDRNNDVNWIYKKIRKENGLDDPNLFINSNNNKSTEDESLTNTQYVNIILSKKNR